MMEPPLVNRAWKLSSLPLLSHVFTFAGASGSPEEPNEPGSVSNHKLWDANPES